VIEESVEAQGHPKMVGLSVCKMKFKMINISRKDIPLWKYEEGSGRGCGL
jgi:hypothetical protein